MDFCIFLPISRNLSMNDIESLLSNLIFALLEVGKRSWEIAIRRTIKTDDRNVLRYS